MKQLLLITFLTLTLTSTRAAQPRVIGTEVVAADSGSSTNQSLTTPSLKGETTAAALKVTNYVRFPRVVLGITTTNVTGLDVSLGSQFTLPLTTDVFLPPPSNALNSTNVSQTIVIHVIQDGTGAHTLTLAGCYKTPTGIVPVLTATANAYDKIILESSAKTGTNWTVNFNQDYR